MNFQSLALFQTGSKELEKKKNWRIKVNEIKSIYVIVFTIRRETCPLLFLNSVQIPQKK